MRGIVLASACTTGRNKLSILFRSRFSRSIDCHILIRIAIPLVGAFRAGRGRFVYEILVIILRAQAIGFCKQRSLVQAQGRVGQRLLEEIFPDGTGYVSAIRPSAVEPHEPVVTTD